MVDLPLLMYRTSPPPGRMIPMRRTSPAYPASTRTLLPTRIGYKRTIDGKPMASRWSFGYDLTRWRCENAVLLGAVAWGIWTLGNQWDERALAGGTCMMCRPLSNLLKKQRSVCLSGYQFFTGLCDSDPFLDNRAQYNLDLSRLLRPVP